jgi:hypothetical protein
MTDRGMSEVYRVRRKPAPTVKPLSKEEVAQRERDREAFSAKRAQERDARLEESLKKIAREQRELKDRTAA